MPIGLTAAATIGAAGIGAGASLIGAHQQSSALNNATDAQTAAYNKALELQQQQYNQQRQDYAPWRAVGLGALSQLAQTENINLPAGFFQGQIGSAVSTANGQGGIGTGATTTQPTNPFTGVAGQVANWTAGRDPASGLIGQQANQNGPAAPGLMPTTQPATTPPATGTTAAQPPAGSPSPGGQFGAFYASPDYNFRVQEGERALTGNKAAAGLLDAGSTGQGLINYGQAAGSQEFGNWYNKIAALAGVGQTATEATTQAGQNATNQMTGLINQQGQNLSSSYISQGKINSTLTSSLGGIGTGLIQNPSFQGMFGGGLIGGSGVSTLGGTGGNGGMIDNLFGSVI